MPRNPRSAAKREPRLVAIKSRRVNAGARYILRVDNAPVRERVGSDLDEVILGHWLHVERMNTNEWWAQLGDAYVYVTVDSKGQAKQVTVERGEYDSPSWPEKHRRQPRRQKGS